MKTTFLIYSSQSFLPRTKVCLDSITKHHPEINIDFRLIPDTTHRDVYVDNLTQIKNKAVKELLEYVKSIWWEPGWGWKQSGRKYWISTGGWSGNEELIGAMHNNFIFWSQCFVQHRRGGHYILEIPKPNKEKAVK